VAGIYALTSKTHPNDRREAEKLLAAALQSGFGFEYLEIDQDLDALRGTASFQRIIDASRTIQRK
jgi:hypothetical protein